MTDSRFSRRDALKALSLVGLSVAGLKADSRLNGFARYEQSARDLRYAKNPVMHGATSTWVKPNELKIASRIAPNTPLAFAPIEGTVKVFEQESGELVGSQVVQTKTLDDYRFTVNFPGLDPRTHYRYEVVADELGGQTFSGQTHSYKVRPKPTFGNTERTFVRLAFANCMEYTRGFWNSFSTLSDRNPDAVFFIGDMIYADVEQFVVGDYSRDDVIGVANEFQVYLLKHLSCNDENRIKLMQKSPEFILPGDHDVADDSEWGNPKYQNRVRDGYKACSLVYASGEDAEVKGFQRSIDFGQGTRAILLDTYRFKDSREGTMLGQDQLAWLKAELGKCKTDNVSRTLIVTPVSFTAGSENTTQGWAAYSRERQQIIDTIAALDLKNVTFVSGDIHRFLAADVHLDPYNIKTDVIANEYEVGATSSNVNHADSSWENVHAFSKHSHGVMEMDVYPDGTLVTRWFLYDAKKRDYVPEEAARFINTPQSRFSEPKFQAQLLNEKLVGNPGKIPVLA